MPVTGDLTRNKSYETQATAIPFTVVDEADIKDKAASVNLSHLSGKQEGAGFLVRATADGALHLHFAEGPAPTDKWQRSAPDDTGTAVKLTPA